MEPIVWHYIIRILMVLAYLGAMVDCWTTCRAISLGAKEANPVMRVFMWLLGAKWMIARLCFALFSTWLVMHDPAARQDWRGAASFGLNCLVLAYVLWNNFGVIAKQSRR